MKYRRIAIYDPNGVNPYGSELARTLSELDREVLLLVPAGASAHPHAAITTRPLLAPSRGRNRSLGYLLNRLASPVRALWASRGRTLVVVWSKDFWDALVFLLVSVFGKDVVAIYHNPAHVRKRRGLGGVAERAYIGRSARIVVHRNFLVPKDYAGVGEVVVIPHPPYLSFMEQFGGDRTRKPRQDSFNLLFIGSLRIDKGATEIEKVIAELGQGEWTLKIAGSGKIRAEAFAAAERIGLKLMRAGDESGVDDAELAASLLETDLLVAPYRSVTESGSVALARTFGIPAVGYADGSLAESLTPMSLAPVGRADVLAKVIREFRDCGGWETYTEPLDVWTRNVRDGWCHLLGSLE